MRLILSSTFALFATVAIAAPYDDVLANIFAGSTPPPSGHYNDLRVEKVELDDRLLSSIPKNACERSTHFAYLVYVGGKNADWSYAGCSTWGDQSSIPVFVK